MYDLIVIGAGAAGMMAAGVAAKQGKDVLLLEKNERPGKKILITGKGRCNLTNDCEVEEMINNFPETGKFLYSALYSFSNWQLREFFADLGVETKVERGGRVFPKSDQAVDIVEALERFIQANNVELQIKEAVEKIELSDDKKIKTVVTTIASYKAENVLVTTGGAAYPTTGSSGDGYKLAADLGHKIVEPKPALVPLESQQDWVEQLQGLTLKNINATLRIEEDIVAEEFGELLFTHFGVSGPTILTLSRKVAKADFDQKISLAIDLKPALSEEQLDRRLQRDFKKYSRKQFKNSLVELLPSKMIPVMAKLATIPADKEVNQITAKQRAELVKLFKGLEIEIKGTKGFRDAIVTTGGVDVTEVDPTTMESKLVPGLYFAGEVLDIDGYTGGFNLQAAFSTAYKAGESVGS